MARSKQILRRAFVNGSLFAGSIVLFEVLLQVFSLWIPVIDRVTVAPWSSASRIVDDNQLEFRGNPSFPEHDEWGFRNTSRPTKASIVTLGDSHTYGTSVQSDQSWPQVLSEVTNRDTYNMGMFWYGPFHSLMNVDLALSLKPDLVIFAFYFGNDLYESFSFAQWNDELEDFISPTQVQEILVLEMQSPLEEEIVDLFTLGESNGEIIELRQWLSHNSKIYGLLRTVKNFVTHSVQAPKLLSKDFNQAVQALKPEQLEYCSVFNGKEWRTIFTAPYRNQALDHSDLRIRAGVDISKTVIKDMNDYVSAAGIEFLVILLPTKESVFWPKVEETNEHTNLEALISNEDMLRNELITFFTNEEIQYLDMLSVLRKAKVQPYFENADGHPNEVGHKIIAGKIAQYIRIQSL